MKITALDRLFSELIRKRALVRVGGCERCLSPKSDILKEDGSIFPAWKRLQCSHFWGRGRKAVRYDEDNGAGLCGACHLYFAAHPSEHRDWFLQRLGQDRFDMLEKRAQIPQKIDENAITLYLQTKIKELEEVRDVAKLDKNRMG